MTFYRRSAIKPIFQSDNLQSAANDEFLVREITACTEAVFPA